MRSAMRAASQLPGRGPLMWMMPLHVNQKSIYDMMMILFCLFDLILYLPSTVFQLNRNGSDFPGLNQH